MKTLLTMSSDNSANSNVISSLKRIGIIDDDDGKPAAIANDWRIDEKYKSTCDTIVKNVYPSELLDLFPEAEVDKTSARAWFMSQGVGQGAADKMVALFSLLKSGEVKDIKSTISKQNKPISKKSSSKPKIPSEITPSSQNADTETHIKHTQTNRPNLHIDLQIHISPESTPEQIEAIFASMEKHLYVADK